ncbi:hypothetical protein [Amnibacterium soli]
MGQGKRTWSDLQADRFFAGFADPTPELVAAVESERGGDLTAVVAESVGYWDRKMAARAARRQERDRFRAAERARVFAESALVHGPNERARLTPATEPSALLLPEARFVLLTDAEYEDTRRWWLRLENPSAAHRLGIRIRREVRNAEQEQRKTDRAAAAWRLEERAFERAQWREVIANRNSRPARKRANQWIAIEEDRALAIAMAALENEAPPQGRN